MKGTTHLASGLALAALWPEPTVAIVAGVAIGAVLPDIDHKSSIIGQHIPILPRLLPHRTITHGLLFAGACAVVSIPLAIGVLTHILADACNPDGVPFLWPLKKDYRILPKHCLVRSGGLFDRLLGAGLWVFVLWHYGALVLGESAYQLSNLI